VNLRMLIEEISRRISEEYAKMCDSFGINPIIGQIYGTILLSDRPLGLDDIAMRTGYSISTVCKGIEIVERIFDVKRFKRPGSKKVYFVCEYSPFKGMRKVFLDTLGENTRNLISTLEECKRELKESGINDKEARHYLSIIELLISDYKRLNFIINSIYERLDKLMDKRFGTERGETELSTM